MSNKGSRIRTVLAASLAVGSTLLLSGGCAQPPRPASERPELGPASYESATVEKPRIRWGAGPTSMNDRCIVRKNKLNLRMPPIFVNGQPVGFC